MRRTGLILLVGAAVVAGGILLASLRVNPYFYFAGYVILQYIVIATAWNILGGYAGYVNFGTPAFFALGAYTAVFLIQSMRAPLPVLILAGGLVSALLGLGIGYLTLRLRGVFFSIATLALSIVLQTMIINWEFVGGSRGLSVIRPSGPPFGNYVTFLFTVMVSAPGSAAAWPRCATTRRRPSAWGSRPCASSSSPPRSAASCWASRGPRSRTT
jgi:branched-chain amino acid transport system permease protein